MLHKFILLSLFIYFAFGQREECAWDGLILDTEANKEVALDGSIYSYTFGKNGYDVVNNDVGQIIDADQGKLNPKITLSGRGCFVSNGTINVGDFIWDPSLPMGDRNPLGGLLYTVFDNSYCVIKFSQAAQLSYKLNALASDIGGVKWLDQDGKQIVCDQNNHKDGTNTYFPSYGKIIPGMPIPAYLNITGQFAIADIRIVYYDNASVPVASPVAPVAPVAAVPVAKKTSEAVATVAIGLLSFITVLVL